MDYDETRARRIAAEAIGERPESAIPAAVREETRQRPEHVARQPSASTGPQANLADIAAEAVGERAGNAYPQMTLAEAQRRSRQLARGAARQRTFAGLSRFAAQPLVAAATGFVLGYVAALLMQRR